jgi:serine/threonine-protein kinase
VQDDIVPVKEIITPPGSPAGLFAGVLVALLLVLGAAFAGIGTPSYAKAGTGVLVDGKDPGASVLSLDFSNPLNVTAGGATGPLAVKVSAAGIAMASETTDASGNVDLGRARFLLSGTGSLEVSAPGTATNTFEVSSSQSPWVTAPAVVAIVALLFALAYVESLSKPLRRGRRRVGSIVGIGVLGGVLGVVLMVLAWVLGAPEISISGLVVGVVLGAAGGVLLALAELRMGQRARLRRAATRS